MAANNDWPGLRRSVDNGLRQIFFLLLPASAFLMVLSMPVVRLVYQRGAFDGYSTQITSTALFFFTIGLVFNGSSLLLIRAFFSMQQPWLPTAIAGGGVVLNAALDAIFYKPFGVGGIPFSTSITSFVTFMLLLHFLSKRTGGLNLRYVLDGFLKSLAAAVFGAVLARSSWYVLDGWLGSSFFAQLIAVGIGALASLVAFLAMAQALNMPELAAGRRLLSARHGVR